MDSSETGQELRQETSVERERIVGRTYQELLGSYLGQDQQPDLDSLNLSEETRGRLKSVVASADSMFASQHERAKEMSIDANAIVAQLHNGPQLEGSQNIDTSLVRLEEPTPGVFIAHLPISEFDKFGRSAQAMAFKPKDGIHFIAVQDGFNADNQTQHLQENLPHELHHLVWATAEKQGNIPINESNENLRAAFRMYRDELLARAVSGGRLGGYTHLENLRPGDKQAFAQNDPEAYKQIREAVDPLYDLLTDQVTKALSDRELPSSILVEPVMMSSSFGELRSSLESLLDNISQLPITRIEKTSSSDWASV